MEWGVSNHEMCLRKADGDKEEEKEAPITAKEVEAERQLKGRCLSRGQPGIRGCRRPLSMSVAG